MEELLPCPGCGKHNGVLRDRGYGLNESTFEYWTAERIANDMAEKARAGWRFC